jgi:signal transduction histidine kinase
MVVLDWLIDAQGLTPHGFCLTWDPGLLWLDALSDGVTMLAYFSIPLAMLWFMRRRQDMPNRWLALLFVAFIVACGATHGLALLTLWVPAYRVEGIAKLITACLSIVTAIALWPLVPRLLKVPSTADMAAKHRELARANGELEAFSYSVSHDLRAPLRAINGYTRILSEDFGADLPAEGRSHLQVVIANTQRMGGLIDALLSFARLGRLPIAGAPIDMAKQVRSVVDDLRPLCDGRGMEIVIGDLPPCHGDPGLVRQILQNLIENAIKYTRTRALARIEIGVREGPELTVNPVFFVADNGVGFDMRYSDRLFGVFQRLHRLEDYEGHGVGLATVRRIVERHGGRIWADAKPDSGATFFFTLGDDRHGDERKWADRSFVAAQDRPAAMAG